MDTDETDATATTEDSPTPAVADVGARAAAELERVARQPLPPGLYLVATPIGNLGDITLRALAVLARADVIYCEDTRHSGVLLSHFGIRRPTRPYHDHNADAQRPRVLADLEQGRRVALISDAGTPLVSDPGYKLVREAAAAGHAVSAIPGASAPLAALVASGLPTDCFMFAGFLPAKSGQRVTRLGELAHAPATLIFFESPQRLAATLEDLATALGGERPAAVGRELTKMHEQMVRAPLSDLARRFADGETRGECVILVGPPVAVEADDDRVREALAAALRTHTLRDAARLVAEDLRVPKARAYDLGLALKREQGD